MSPDTTIDDARDRVGDADAKEDLLDALICDDLFIPVLTSGDAFESLAFELAKFADIDMMPLNVTIAS